MNLLDLSRWLPRRRPRRGGRRASSLRGMQVFRFSLAAIVIAVLTYFSPYQRPWSVPELRIGTEAQGRIESVLLFQVRKRPDELERERFEAERKIPTILNSLSHVGLQQTARLDSVLDILLPTLTVQMAHDSLKAQHLQKALPYYVGELSEESLGTLIEILSEAPPVYVEDFRDLCIGSLRSLYATGILDTKKRLQESVTDQVRIVDSAGNRAARMATLAALFGADDLSRGDMPSLPTRGVIGNRDAIKAVNQFLRLFITPNLAFDAVKTDSLRGAARQGVASIQRIYVEGDVIIEKGSVVTQGHVDALTALADEIVRSEREDPIKLYLQTMAATLVTAFLTFVFGYYLATREPEIYVVPAQLFLIAIIVISTAGIASYIHTNELHKELQTFLYLTPTPLATMLTTILINPQVALVLSLILSLFVGSIFGDFYVTLTCALTSAVAVYSVLHVRHRNQFFRSMIFLPLSYAALIAAADLLRFVPLEQIYRDVLPGIAIGVIAPILTMGMLPVFETLFRITTDITLLELSDLNRPLLRDLAIRAPGTYTHSLIMANLSESAAEAIEANALLARVGCYYHDIGKMGKAEYFAENQVMHSGLNAHDHLTPTMSMLVITSHVKDGIALAEHYGLPKAISDLIPQHHGTTVVEYFYNRAIEMGDESVRENDFRYDGPKPQTKEGGILMLADSVESATRTLGERTPNRVRQLVRNITQQKFSAGELDECDLTLQDLHKIEESFIPVLMGTLHDRVEYPWQKEERRRR